MITRLAAGLLAVLLFNPPGPVRAAEGGGGPIQHFVFFRFKKEAGDEQVQRVVREFEQLPSKIPGIVAFQWGTDNSPEGLQKGFTHAFIMTFKDAGVREHYVEHAEHKKFVELAQPLLDGIFVFDFSMDRAPPPAEPGRVHHLVFFKYKPEAGAEQIDGISKAFADLPRQISGLLRYQAGPNNSPADFGMGFTHGFWLTFLHADAREDYLPHAAHLAFIEKIKPILAEAFVLDFTVRPSGKTFLVTEGLEPFQVYQRGEDGKGALKFAGLAGGDGAIEARLLGGRRVIEGFDWTAIGKAAEGRFQASLAGVPAGGEYTLELRRRDELGNIAESTEVGNILVGDLWILAGQSNMEGVGDLRGVESPSRKVHCFTMAHRWELAVEPLHWLIDSRDPVHSSPWLKDQDEEGRRKARADQRAHRSKGSGLGLPFAKHMVKSTGIPVGLIAAAHGGTSMAQWDPALRAKGSESLYGSMLKQARRAGGKVRGVLWYQGESDANEKDLPLFAERFKGLVAAFREDLGNPGLPFYHVQIGSFVRDPGSAEFWNGIQDLQRKLAAEIPGTAVAGTVDLTLDDAIHIGTAGLKRLGARLSKIARRELFQETALKTGPRFSAARLDNPTTIRVEYTQVNGQLTPAEKVLGFSIRGAAGAEIPLIYNASVDLARPDSVILKLRQPLPPEAVLWYGAGFSPVCNLVDSEDMGALVFGPVRVE